MTTLLILHLNGRISLFQYCLAVCEALRTHHNAREIDDEPGIEMPGHDQAVTILHVIIRFVVIKSLLV